PLEAQSLAGIRAAPVPSAEPRQPPRPGRIRAPSRAARARSGVTRRCPTWIAPREGRPPRAPPSHPRGGGARGWGGAAEAALASSRGVSLSPQRRAGPMAEVVDDGDDDEELTDVPAPAPRARPAAVVAADELPVEDVELVAPVDGELCASVGYSNRLEVQCQFVWLCQRHSRCGRFARVRLLWNDDSYWDWWSQCAGERGAISLRPLVRICEGPVPLCVAELPPNCTELAHTSEVVRLTVEAAAELWLQHRVTNPGAVWPQDLLGPPPGAARPSEAPAAGAHPFEDIFGELASSWSLSRACCAAARPSRGAGATWLSEASAPPSASPRPWAQRGATQRGRSSSGHRSPSSCGGSSRTVWTRVSGSAHGRRASCGRPSQRLWRASVSVSVQLAQLPLWRRARVFPADQEYGTHLGA
ncbi:unnamed protein product, partial [Prorocentrum cordatum]